MQVANSPSHSDFVIRSRALKLVYSARARVLSCSLHICPRLPTHGHCIPLHSTAFHCIPLHSTQTGNLLVPLIAHTLYDAIIVLFVHLDVSELSRKEQQEIIAAGAEGP